MGIYTIRKEKIVDDTISLHMRQIVKTIKSEFKLENIYSIIITGSFGRGEGSVLINRGKVTPLNDYDLLLILTKTQKYGNNIHKKADKIASEFNIDFVDIDVVSLKNFERFCVPNIFNYDLLSSTKVLYGKNFRIQKINQNKIPIEEAYRLIFNRIGGMLMAKYLIEKNKKYLNLNRFVYFQCMKSILSLGDLYLLKNGSYASRYTEKIKLIERSNIDLEFKKSYIKFAKYKLKPNFEYRKIDPFKFWENTRQLHLNFFMKLEKQRNIKSIFDWHNHYINSQIQKTGIVDKIKYFVGNIKVFGVSSHFLNNYSFLNPGIRRRSISIILFSLFGQYSKSKINLCKIVLNNKSNDIYVLIKKYLQLWHEFPPEE